MVFLSLLSLWLSICSPVLIKAFSTNIPSCYKSIISLFRNVKLGEVGCFLSHRKIWTEIVENRLALTLILEDDVQFATSNGDVEEFRTQLDGFVKEFVRLDGDLLLVEW